jgi:anti-sigma factor RsiW
MNDNHEHEFPDELISAYLDGELSPAEKVRVEEQLMDSAEHRRLFEELKSLRRSLQALPAESLGEDFAARVLRRAERELLAEAPAAEVGKAKESSAAPPVVASVREAERVALPNRAHGERGARRGLVWSVIATAAAVGLLIYGPLLNQEQQQLTQGTARPEGAQQPLSHLEKLQAPQATTGSSNESEPSAREVDEAMAPTPPTDFAAPVETRLEADNAKPASGAPAREAAAESAEMAKENERFGNGSTRFNGSNGFRDSRALRGPAPEGEMREDHSLDLQAREATEKAMADAPDTSAKANEVEEQIGPQIAGGDGVLPMPTAVRARGQGGAAVSAPAGPASPALLVVTVDVKRSSLSAKFFDELLQSHDIQVEFAADKAPSAELADQVATADSVADNSVADASDEDSGNAEGRNRPSANEEDATSGGGLAGATFGAELKERASHPDIDLMYVEATQAQIDGLLRDLRAQPDDVLAMTYGDDFLAKEKAFAEANGLPAERQFRALMEAKEMEQLRSAALAAPLNDNENVAALSEPPAEAGAKPEPASEAPFSQAADEVAQVDALGAADRKQDDLKLAEQKKSGFARRLSLQDGQAPAKFELQAGAGGAAASRVATPAPADVAEAASPAAPPANLADGGNQSAKAKKQEETRVRVLFVLRAVAPSPAADAEAAPAEPQVEPQP